MLQMKSMVDVADNTGAKLVGLITILGFSRKRYGRIGDVCTGTVRRCLPGSAIKKGDKVLGVIVRTRQAMRREDGTWVRFDSNAMVLLDAEHKPRGTRVFGAVPRELRGKFMRIITLAAEVV